MNESWTSDNKIEKYQIKMLNCIALWCNSFLLFSLNLFLYCKILLMTLLNSNGAFHYFKLYTVVKTVVGMAFIFVLALQLQLPL